MDRTEALEKAEMQFAALSKQLTYTGGATESTLNMRRSMEAKYNQAYGRLVKLGTQPMLRKKYRRP